MSQKPDSLTLSENTMYHQVVDQLNEAVQGIYPDLPFELINLSTKFKNASINDFIKALKQTITKIFYPTFNSDPHNWTICIGAHIFLIDNQLNSCPLTWQAKKIKNIVHSTTASETLNLQEASEHATFL